MPSLDPLSVAEAATESKVSSRVSPFLSTVSVICDPAGTARMSEKGVLASITSWRVPSGVVMARRMSPFSTIPSALDPSTAPSIVTVAGTSHPRYSSAATWEVVCELRIIAS